MFLQVSKMIFGALIIVTLSTLIQGYGVNPVTVTIEPKNQVAVKAGQSLRILCTVPTQISACRVSLPDQSIVLNDHQQPEGDGIEYYGNGTVNGHCGVHITSVQEKYDGNFTCAVVPLGKRSEIFASVKIVVAKPPLEPQLHVSEGSVNRNTFKLGEKMIVSCSAFGGRPAANLSLYLDNEPLENEYRMYNGYSPATTDDSTAVLNSSKVLNWYDNGKMLRCFANHIALDRPRKVEMQLQVYFPPQPPKDQPIQRFGYVIGRRGEVNVTVLANPRPNFVWIVNGEKINEGRPDESGRLETSTAVDEGNGQWNAILNIDSVQKSDTEKEYTLQADNSEGSFSYMIALSTSAEPAGVDLDAGSIIGIVIGVMVLLLAIFMVIFARATGRWCFAGTAASKNAGETDVVDPAASVNLLRFDKRKSGEASPLRSDTESAGRYSRTEVDSSRKGRKINLTQFFKRNKDKVSGGDTDTMRTVIMDDDKTGSPPEKAPANEGPVYADLDFKQQNPQRIVNTEKTEYAEILIPEQAKSEPVADQKTQD